MAMKYLGAYMMTVIGGKESPSANDIKTILDAGGIECEQEMLDRVMQRMEGKQVHELIAEGYGKFAACGGGGGGGGVLVSNSSIGIRPRRGGNQRRRIATDRGYGRHGRQSTRRWGPSGMWRQSPRR
mmetsp:Transcript_28892/g.83722  ORF Transcript_28892/g.83722 Transcript_28892/m.83722 type:complete len:127 (+) Transcript_28892:81-461(+)